MRFRELPPRLQLYIAAHLLILVPLALQITHARPPADWQLLSLLVISTIVFGTWKVELTVFQGKMTLVFAAVCLAQLMLGEQAAVLCAMLGAFVATVAIRGHGSSRITLQRARWYRIFLNLGNCALTCVLSSILFEKLAPLSPRADVGQVLGLAAFTASYFLVNTAGIALAIAFQQSQPWTKVWKENFLWTAPGFFASASVAAGIQAAHHIFGVWSLLLLPPLYVVYFSYRLYMERLNLYSEKVRQDMAHIEELNRLNQAIIASLATAIDAKDRYTCSHINRVQMYATALGEVAGVTGPERDAIATGALVHDIGKLGIPDHILGKPGKLTPEEFKRIQTHVTIGAEILSPVPFPFPVVDVVMTHHERWDGLGYPRGLKGEEIPIGGRIISIVDVFDALTSDRPYRRAMPLDKALEVLREGAGKQFDPRMVELFAQVLPEVRKRIEVMEASQAKPGPDEAAQPDAASALTRISQAAAEMAAVCDVAHSLSDEQTLDGVVRVVLDRATTLIPTDTVVLYLTCPIQGHLVATAVQGKYADKLRAMTIELGEGVAGWVAQHQQAKVNVSASPDVARRFSPEETIELSAATAVPLVHGPDNIGVLAAYTQAYSVLSEHHLNMLNILAEHAAAAIQNLRRIERNQEMAFTDPLTGLSNSRCLFRHLDRLIGGEASGGSDGAPFGVVMLDLDHFKLVNDALGHLRGDDVLRMVGHRLESIARPGDVVCRYAGDEFVLLLPGCGAAQADAAAARVREAIDSILPIDGRVKIGASVGVSTYPSDEREPRGLLHVADQRMYEDKFQRRRDPLTQRGLAPAREMALAGKG